MAFFFPVVAASPHRGPTLGPHSADRREGALLMVDLLGTLLDNEGDEESVERHWKYALRVYLLWVVGYTIFANRSKNDVHLAYLRRSTARSCEQEALVEEEAKREGPLVTSMNSKDLLSCEELPEGPQARKDVQKIWNVANYAKQY
ncbi:hypothetical protein TSUD_188360 [Trifolium subterraneum]|uniref:Uncharacterized protein n=1 Tax=Trifolium subterraneum TaxID=3900 RepID=A0A2Z6NX98_TRISU|nr:hypothetical protein TSUD_188360 [Trifolium subterraneum]